MSSELSAVSPGSLIAALLRNRGALASIVDDFRESLNAGNNAERFACYGRIVTTVGPVIDDLQAELSSAPEGGFAAAAPETHAEMCGAAGFDWSTVEKVVALLVQILPLFLGQKG